MAYITAFLNWYQNIAAPAVNDLLIFGIMIAVYIVWSKIDIPVMESIFWVVMAGIAVICGRMGVLPYLSQMGSSLAIFYLCGMTTAAEMYLIHYLPITISDVCFLALAVSWLRGGMGFLGMKILFLFLILWSLLCVIVKRRMGKVIENSVSCFLCFMAGLAGYFLFSTIFDRVWYPIYARILYRYQPAAFVKVLILTVMSGILLFVLAGCFAFINRLFHAYFVQLTHYGKKYKELSRYTFWMPFGVCGILFLLFLLGASRMLLGFWYYYEEVINIFAVIILGSQMLTVRMVLNSVKLKEHLLQEEVHREQMSVYNSQLANNLDNLRAMKHDLKNIFFTMGEYVERSQDEEMKVYYREHIIPFAGQELKTNDLYVQLQEIQNEPLRAFFYYKCMQGMEQGIDLRLQTQMDGSYFRQFYQMTDLSRILGIFLDNAMEEAICTEEKKVEVTIREQSGCMSIRIWNQVRDEVQHRGVHAGTTTKGLGRGKGLEIAKKLILQYDDLLWNSYFQDGGYVQVLSAGISGPDAAFLART